MKKLVKHIKEGKKTALTDYQKDVIKEMVQTDFEVGQITNDYDELVDLLKEDEDLANVAEKAASYYMELVELGPAGFYEEFKDELDFDPDFVAEYGGHVEFDWVADVYNDFVSDVCEEAGYPEDLDEDRIYDDFNDLLDDWNEGEGRDEYDDVRDYLKAHLNINDYIPEDDDDDEDYDEEDD